VIAATHRDLETRIAEGAFREDLYYRLNVANIVIPPLRDRRDEIMPLASLFLKKHKGADASDSVIDPELKAALFEYHWPGNIRELENVMRRYMVLKDSGIIVEELQQKTRREREMWRQSALSAPRQEAPAAEKAALISDYAPDAENGASSSAQGNQGAGLAGVNEARKRAETEVIIQALNSTLWNRKRAAALLGTDYKALLYKMKKLGIG
jgi:two-component system response regulator AtoC